MNSINKITLIRLLEQALAAIKELPVKKSCHECVNFKLGFCTLVGTAPPKNIIENGCESFLYDETQPPF